MSTSIYGYTQPADIEWRGAIPYNRHYRDIYYNAEQGFAEAEHVCIGGNNLAHRFQTQTDDWVIAETGFGTGLNFLITWLYWDRYAPATGTLTYIACEACPLANNQIARALVHFPQLSAYLDILLTHLPPLIEGSYLVKLTDRVELILHYQQADRIFPRLQFEANAWYLDGFAPSRNPELWTLAICQHIARCSAPQATLATYSVARQLRNRLEQCGFTVKKVPGCNRKQQILVGALAHRTASRRSPKTIAVIGAGYAGCSCAALLSQRGWQVDVFESEKGAVSRASANRSAVIHFKPEALRSPIQQVKWAAYVYALSYYNRIHKAHFEQKPMRLAPQDARGMKWMHRWQTAYRHRAIQGYFTLDRTADHGLYFTRAGSVDLVAISRALLEHHSIRMMTGRQITAIRQSAQGFTLNNERTEYSQVVVAVNQGIQSPLNSWNIRTQAHKGHISYFRPPSSSARAIYCSTVFLNITSDDWQVGGGFMPGDTADTELVSNRLQRLQRDFPTLTMPDQYIRSWSDVRTAGTDHLPIVGKVAAHPTQSDSGIYLHLAHGGKGSLMIPLCSRLLVDMLSNRVCLPYGSLFRPDR